MSIANKIRADFHPRVANNAIVNIQVLYEALATFGAPVTKALDSAGTAQSSVVTVASGAPAAPSTMNLITESLEALHGIMAENDPAKEELTTIMRALNHLGFQVGV